MEISPSSSRQTSRKRPRPLPAAAGSSAPPQSSQQPRPYHDRRRQSEITRADSNADLTVGTADFTDTSVSNASEGEDDAPLKETTSKETPAASSKTKSSPKDEMQDAMQDNLDLMLEIVMRMRDDPEFASGIYKDCPRLQHMLDQRPSLRPLFEDPKLVRINFEEVYRKAGGVLPEERKPKSLLQRFIQSPIFKVLKVFLCFKKLLSCMMGGGVALTGAFFSGLFGADDHGGGDHDADHDAEVDEHNKENREALDRAADRMDDKETQQRMHQICEEHDPQKLLEEIEDNPELKALRDANPLCAELMSDPETMKILVDPDNLRSLGDAPELIEKDFADPNWSPPDVDTQALDSGGLEGDHPVHGSNASMIPDDSFQQEQLSSHAAEQTELAENSEVQQDVVEDDVEEGEEEEEEEEEEGMEYELGEADNDGGGNSQTASKSSAAKKTPQKQQKTNTAPEGGTGLASFLGNVRAGITDMVAAELVGMSVSEITTSEFGDLESAADESANAAEDVEQAAMALDSASEMIDAHGDAIDGLEEGLDGAEEAQDGAQDGASNKAKAAGVAGGGGAAGAGAATVAGGSRARGDVEEGNGEDEEEEKKGRFGFFKNFTAAVSTAMKEQVAGSILGDDIGEMLVEKIEEDEEDDEEKESDEEEEDDDDDEEVSLGDFAMALDGGVPPDKDVESGLS